MGKLNQHDAVYYYFTRTLYLKNELDRRSYYFNAPISFNDPFDCDFHHLEEFVENLSEEELYDIKSNSHRVFIKSKIYDLEKKLQNQIVQGYIDIFGIRGIQKNSNNIASGFLENKFDSLSDVEKINDLKKCKKELKKWLKSTLRNTGIKCLTSKWYSAPMWAHYGDVHRGICVGVYYPNNMFKNWQHNVGHFEIKYVDEIDIPKRDMHLRDLIQRFMTTKYKEWEYENESRIISFKSSGYISFRCSSLREIILGAKWFDEPKSTSSFEYRSDKLELVESIFDLRRAQGAKKCKIFISYVKRGSRYVCRSEVPCGHLSRIVGALNKGLNSERAFEYIMKKR